MEAGIDDVGGHALSAAVTLPYEFKTSQLLVRAGGGYRGRDGLPLPGDIVEPIPGANPDLRTNTDVRHSDAFAAVRYQARGGSWAAFTTSGFDARRGIPAELHMDGARYWRYPVARRGLAVISGGTGERTSPFGGVGDIELSIGLDAARTEIDQYASRSYDEVVANEDSDDRNVTLRMRADQTLSARAQLGTAITYADINHDELLTPGASASYRQRLWSAAAELSLRTADAGRLRGTRINAGIAYDGADTPESGDKPPLSMLHNWGARAGFTSLTANGRVLLHGGVSRRVRFPALRELYSGALGRFEPNPDLVPEKLVAAEAGSTWRLGRGEVQAVAFYHVLSDAIVRTSVAGGRFKRVNRDRQSATGAELLATVGIEAVSLGAELTIQDTWLSDDRGVASEPEYQPDVVAGVSAGASLPFGVRADARGKYIGRQMCVNAETNAQSVIASSRRVDAEAAKSWRMRGGWLSTLEASVAVDNISDATIYDQCGLPQPGRIMRLQVRLR